MFKAAFRSATRAALIAIALPCAPAPCARADELPEIVVTADRIEEPIGQTGASVTIIPGAEVEKLGSKGLAEVLRGVAGLDVDEAGGVGAVTQVHLRGSNPGETLVLIDGVRIGNPSSTDGSLDFGNLAAVDIERIEVLRGPQSALYGSDAMGGVINIITRKGGQHAASLGDGGGGQLRHDLDASVDVGRRRPLDLFAGRQRAARGRLSPLRLSHRPPADDRRRRHPAAALAGGRSDQQGGRERAVFLSPLRRRRHRRRIRGRSATRCASTIPTLLFPRTCSAITTSRR